MHFSYFIFSCRLPYSNILNNLELIWFFLLQDDANGKTFTCGLCPYECKNRHKLVNHRQFHRPRGHPFSCPHCSYNVTRRHLLAQHVRVHGISPNLLGLEDSPTKGNSPGKLDRSKSPSPSLTITPVTNTTTCAATKGGNSKFVPNPSLLPILYDKSTRHLDDIPLVWVSKEDRFFKMFKCRHCPHVNLRKTNIQEHEKMHRGGLHAAANGSSPVTGLSCPHCSYVSVNAGVMSSHVKVHNGSLGKCHAFVHPSIPEEQQLRNLTNPVKSPQPNPIKLTKDSDEKVLYCCQHCPARFFLEKEIQIHTRFHGNSVNLPHTCDKCNYGARQQPHLLAHAKVHTPEYQERTRTLMTLHRPATSHPPTVGLTIPRTENMNEKSRDPIDLMNSTKKINSVNSIHTSDTAKGPAPTNRYKCDKCPSTFGKLLTLQYHQSLHSGSGTFKCNRCTYACNTEDGLKQHTNLHVQADKEKVQDLLKIKENEELDSFSNQNDSKKLTSNVNLPPIKLKFIGLKDSESSSNKDESNFKYYIEQDVPLSGLDLLKKKKQLQQTNMKNIPTSEIVIPTVSSKPNRDPDDPKRIGDPSLNYPLHIDKATGKSREKRYKCSKCPSAFEKLDQYNVHIGLHGFNMKYQCKICDYSVKFFANFRMHINRHKYHEHVEAQKLGKPAPPDDADKYEPRIACPKGNSTPNKENSPAKNVVVSNKENQEVLDPEPDLTTTEKQHLLLQQKKGSEVIKDDDKRIYYCQYCPYANARRDGVDSHSMRHKENGGRGLYRCNFCDYHASQPNFIKEHTKVHFRTFKYVIPEGYMRLDRQEISRTVTNSYENDEEEHTIPRKKSLIFSHDRGKYSVAMTDDTGELQRYDPQEIVDCSQSTITVDFKSAEVVEAPSDYIIHIKNSKGSKSTDDSDEINNKMLPPSSVTRLSSKKKKYAKNSKDKGKKSLEVPITTDTEPSTPPADDISQPDFSNSISSEYPESSVEISDEKNDDLKVEKITDENSLKNGLDVNGMKNCSNDSSPDVMDTNVPIDENLSYSKQQTLTDSLNINGGDLKESSEAMDIDDNESNKNPNGIVSLLNGKIDADGDDNIYQNDLNIDDGYNQSPAQAEVRTSEIAAVVN